MTNLPPEVIMPYRMLYWGLVAALLVVVVVGVLFFSVSTRSNDFDDIFETTPNAQNLNPIFQTATALRGDRVLTPTAESTFPADLPIAGGGGGGYTALTENRYRQLDERIIIKDVDMRLLVEDVEATVSAVVDLVKESGGWMVNTSISNLGKSAYVVLRVPSDELDSLLEAFRQLAIEVTNENINSSDVTDDYVDLQSQLTNLEAAENQLQEIMESADDTEDVIAVFNQLTRVRGDIERIKGLLQFYADSAAYSAVTLNINPYVPEVTPQATRWSPSHAFNAATDSAVKSVEGGIDVLIWAVVYGVLLLLIMGLPLVLLLRWLVSK